MKKAAPQEGRRRIGPHRAGPDRPDQAWAFTNSSIFAMKSAGAASIG